MNALRFASVGLALSLLLAAGCGRDIGDECQNSVDCDPNGTRTCDQSQPGGYCTVAGCDETSCPEDSVCIRYFPVMYLSKPCQPKCEDVYQCMTGDCPEGDPSCAPPCPRGCTATTNDCSADELCLDVGLCARRSLEKRSCAKACGSNDDCRGGYECRATGTRGSMLLSTQPGAIANFCAPFSG